MKEIKINDLFTNKDKEITTIINNININHPYINNKQDFINIYNKYISKYKVIYYGKEIELYKLYDEFQKISKNMKMQSNAMKANRQPAKGKPNWSPAPKKQRRSAIRL
mgnify:CR=1 FL=1